ncbi:DUF2752 domain-containing protein [Leptolyngbya iicbica]|nr:DUF2752 domain-containing protein [Leptolyngbya sp. LK]
MGMDDQPVAVLPQLRSPFWRIVTLTTFLSPLAIAIAVSQWGLRFPFPPCLFQWAFGFPAPSCGLTRSVVALMAGDWSRSLSYHLFGPVFVVLATALTLATSFELVTRRSLVHWYEGLWRSRSAVLLLSLYVMYYGLRLWIRYTLPSLPWGLDDTIAWQQLVAGAIAL